MLSGILKLLRKYYSNEIMNDSDVYVEAIIGTVTMFLNILTNSETRLHERITCMDSIPENTDWISEYSTVTLFHFDSIEILPADPAENILYQEGGSH